MVNIAYPIKEQQGNDDISPNFYRTHAKRYAEINKLGLQRTFMKTSHKQLKGNDSLLKQLKTLIPGIKGLDAGCGAGAIDVATLMADGYDMCGIDSIAENIEVGIDYHPLLKDRLLVGDLAKRLVFPNESFDFVMCNAVIQHIPPSTVYKTTLPELARVLKHRGILQLMFKTGNEVTTVFDKDYGVNRSFQLFQVKEILDALKRENIHLVEATNDEALGGLMYFTNPKADQCCVFYARKIRE